jgi:hypothetical protein
MIKKNTLLVLLCAVVLGGAVYYFDWKRNAAEKPPADTAKPAFSIQAPDISSLTLARPAQKDEPAIHLEKRGDAWQIVQPIATDADQPSVEGIVDGLVSARVNESEPGTPDRLKAYGLDRPAMSLEFQLKNGQKHTLLMGDKDFTDIYVYSIVDGAKNVSLLPESLLTSSDKPLDKLRDHTVLHVSSTHVASFDLKNRSGELAAAKQKGEWKFTKPIATLADETNVNSLLGAVDSGRMVSIASEKSENLGKYGLAPPAIAFSAADDAGKTAVLLIGKKEGEDYFARDPSRPVIFTINEELYKKLSESYSDLRDRKVIYLTEANINHVEIHNASGVIAATRKGPDEWTADVPADIKGKSAETWKIFGPLSRARGDDVLDHPPADLTAKLAHPAVEVVLTSKDGKKVTVQISKEAGDFVYVQTSESHSLYKLKKQILSELNFNPSDFSL